MKKTLLEFLLIFIIGVIFILLIALNVKDYNRKLEAGQIKAKDYTNMQLY